MNKDFCSKLKGYIEKYDAKLVGRRVWFCPNRDHRLECVIAEDGSIAVDGFRERTFNTASELISAIFGGLVVQDGFKLPENNRLTNCRFSNSLYFMPDGTELVYRYIKDPSLPLPPLDLPDGSGTQSLQDRAPSERPGFSNGHPAADRVSFSSLEKERRTEMDDFWQRVIKSKPDIIGTTVYFCPSTRANLPCIVRGDGTVSPICALGLRYDSAAKLANAIKNDEMPGLANFHISRTISPSIYNFSDYFFVRPGRSGRVRDLFGVTSDVGGYENENVELMELSDTATVATSSALPDQDTDLPGDMDAPHSLDMQMVNGSEDQDQDQSSSNQPPNDDRHASLDSEQQTSRTSTIMDRPVAARPETEEERLGRSKDFWRIAILVKPELIGKAVSFFPTTKLHVPCVVNGDGTFSPTCDMTKRYCELCPFIQDIKAGMIPLVSWTGTVHTYNSKYGRITMRYNWTRYNFGKHFLMSPHHTVRVCDFLGRFKLCPGIEREQFDDIIIQRQWEGERMEVSPLIFEGEKMRAKRCSIIMLLDRKLKRCDACHKGRSSLGSMRGRSRNKQPNDEKRIRFSGNCFLTDAERRKKTEMLQRQMKRKADTVRQQARKIRRLEEELKNYKPEHRVNRGVVQNLVVYLNEETQKMESPKCQWIQGDMDEDVCGFVADSVISMCAHVNSEHHQTQLQVNAMFPEEERQYYCRWKGCARRPFSTAYQLHLHLFDHTGSRASVQRLQMIRCQLDNLIRAPTGRRYNQAVTQQMLSNMEKDASSDAARTRIGLPVPSESSVRKMIARAVNGDGDGSRRMDMIGNAIQSVLGRQEVNRGLDDREPDCEFGDQVSDQELDDHESDCEIDNQESDQELDDQESDQELFDHEIDH